MFCLGGGVIVNFCFTVYYEICWMQSKLGTKKLKIYFEHEKVSVPQITKAYLTRKFNGTERYAKVVFHAEYAEYKKLDKKRCISQ